MKDAIGTIDGIDDRIDRLMPVFSVALHSNDFMGRDKGVLIPVVLARARLSFD